MQTFKCPKCGSDIEVIDTTIYNDDDLLRAAYRMRIDTAVTHKQMILDEDCLILFKLFVEDQKAVVNHMLTRAMKHLSQDFDRNEYSVLLEVPPHPGLGFDILHSFRDLQPETD